MNTARGWGFAGAGVVAAVLAVLLGGFSALSLGGQNGRLLWADLAVAAALGVALVRGRGRVAVHLPAPLVAALPLIAWSALTLPLARDPLTAISELKEWIVAWGAGALAAGFAVDARRARSALALVALAGALTGAHMIVVAATAKEGFVFAVLLKHVDLPWGRTNYLAGVLALALPVALGLAASARGTVARALPGALAVACAAGLVVSASKGGILALAVGFVIALAGGGRAAIPVLLGVVALAGAAAWALLATPLEHAVAYRLQASALEYSAGERFDLYRLAWDEFLRAPLTGIGLNNFSVAAHRLTGVDTVPHNFALGYLAELGLPGLAFAMLAAGSIVVAAWRGRCAAPATERGLALGVWAAVVAAAVHNQFESTVCGGQYKILFAIAAVATARLAAAWDSAREEAAPGAMHAIAPAAHEAPRVLWPIAR